MLSTKAIVSLFFFFKALQLPSFTFGSASNERTTTKGTTRLRRPLDHNNVRRMKSSKGKSSDDSPPPLFVTVEEQPDGHVEASVSNDLPPSTEIADEDLFPSKSMSLSLSYSYNYTKTAIPPPPLSKTSWPECVIEPLTCVQCQNRIIEENNPGITIIAIVPDGSPVTKDIRTDRVRIYCKNSTVTDIPVVA